jgi:hypothetical protein
MLNKGIPNSERLIAYFHGEIGMDAKMPTYRGSTKYVRWEIGDRREKDHA